MLGRHASLTAALLVVGRRRPCHRRTDRGRIDRARPSGLGVDRFRWRASPRPRWCSPLRPGVAAQLTEGAGAARGIAVGFVGFSFLLRVAGDGGEASGIGWLSWLSPIGWFTRLRPFASERWPVVLLFLGFGPCARARAYGLSSRSRCRCRRDRRRGPGPAAAARLASVAARLLAGGSIGLLCSDGRSGWLWWAGLWIGGRQHRRPAGGQPPVGARSSSSWGEQPGSPTPSSQLPWGSSPSSPPPTPSARSCGSGSRKKACGQNRSWPPLPPGFDG